MKEDNIKELYESMQLSQKQNEKIVCAIEKKYHSKKRGWSSHAIAVAASFALLFMGSMIWYMGIHLQKENDTPVKDNMVIKETEQPKIAGEKEDLRAKILENPGELVYLTSENLDGIDQALIDLNGDGEKEHLRFVLKETSSLEHYKGDLYVNNAKLKNVSGRKGNLGQGIDADIYGISLGTEDIYLVTLDSEGELDDATTHFYSYTKDTSKNSYFTYATNYAVKLKEKLPVAPDLEHPDATIIMKPQKVQYTRISVVFNMIYLEAEDGTTGWMKITHTEENPLGYVVALNKKVFEVFDGLRSAG